MEPDRLETRQTGVPPTEAPAELEMRFYRWPVMVMLGWFLVLAAFGALWRAGFISPDKDTVSLVGAIITASAAVLVLASGKFVEIDLDHSRHERERQEERREREREQREILVALSAEIASNLRRQRVSYAGVYRERVISRIRALPSHADETQSPKDADGTGPERAGRFSEPPPVSPVDGTNYVLDAVKLRIFTLPAQIIETVVTYYNLNGMFGGAIPRDPNLPRERLAQGWHSVFELTNDVDKAAVEALGKLCKLTGDVYSPPLDILETWPDAYRADQEWGELRSVLPASSLDAPNVRREE
jgi:hypothetical protein